MGILDRLIVRVTGKELVERPSAWFEAAAAAPKSAGQLPVQPPPKVKNKQQTLPSSFPSAAPSESAVLIRREQNLANSDTLALRFGASTLDTIRDFITASPDLSAAVSANLRLGISESYRMKAWNPDGTFNPDATRLAYQLAQRMEMVPDYSEGFNAITSFLSTSEMLGKDMMSTGAMSMELVLDKSRLPSKFVPISTAQIVWFPDVGGKAVVPKQLISGTYIDLDLPTFFYVALDQDVRTAYAGSPLESALQPVVADADFRNDMRRIIKRSVYPRLDISIDEEILAQSIPPEIAHDPVKLKEYRDAVQADVASVINGLLPEDALVHYSFLTVTFIDGSQHAPQEIFAGIQKMIDAKLSTGAKTLPSVLGHGSGSQNVASSETLLAMKTADGMIRRKLNEMYSKGMTLAVRLFGLDVAVSFEYESIDLRPTIELEAFRAQRQSRILEQLSFGMITDEEACIDLTGMLPPPGMKPLSGTMFSSGLGKGGENPYSNAPAGGGSGSGSGGDAGQKGRNSDAPTGTRGKKSA